MGKTSFLHIGKVACAMAVLVILASCGDIVNSEEQIQSDSMIVEDSDTKEQIERFKEFQLAEKVIEEYLADADSLLVPHSYCAVLDLNQNEKPEIIIASCVGTGHYTYFSIFELDFENGSIERFNEFDFPGNDFSERAPDIIQEKINGFYDLKQKEIKYYVPDILREGAYIEHDDLLELSFGKKRAIRSVLCIENELTDKGEINSFFYDDKGKEISSEEYKGKLKEIENNCNVSYSIKWIKLNELSPDNDIREKQLLQSYKSREIETENVE